MKFTRQTRKGHNRQQQRQPKQQPPRREDEEIISISYSDMYTSSTVGEPAYDMEMVQEMPEPASSMIFSTFHETASFPSDVQSVIRNQRCSTEDFEVVFREVEEDFTPKQKNQTRLFQLLTSPTNSSNSSDANKRDLSPQLDEEEVVEPSCFGSRWELTVWSISAIFVMSLTVLLCALLYNRRIGDDTPVTAAPFTLSTLPPQWTSSALNVTTTTTTSP